LPTAARSRRSELSRKQTSYAAPSSGPGWLTTGCSILGLDLDWLTHTRTILGQPRLTC
jgi:hypothetical protein